jgi:hypothetical protein
LLLVGAVLLAALILVLIKRWNNESAPRDTAHDQLAHFRDMFQHGEISKEEYQRVHSLLATKIRAEEAAAAPPPAAPDATKPASSEPPATSPGDEPK